MKKKILAVCATVAIAALAVGGTLAYYTAEDDAKNVMTLGNVDIEQIEQQRQVLDDGNLGGMEPFEQEQDLFPMVDNRGENDPVVDAGFFNAKMENVIDKIVTVKNTGSAPAYVRTIIAFETAKVYAEGSDTEWKDAHAEYFGILDGGLEYVEDGRFSIDGTEYVAAVLTYEGALAPNAVSAPSLKQFFLAPTAGNEVTTLFGETYDILCLSQAVQIEGFVNGAEAALNTAFGEVTAANCAVWFEDIA